MNVQRVYNGCMPTYKLNWIKNIQVNSSKNASNKKWDKICPEN